MGGDAKLIGYDAGAFESQTVWDIRHFTDKLLQEPLEVKDLEILLACTTLIREIAGKLSRFLRMKIWMTWVFIFPRPFLE